LVHEETEIHVLSFSAECLQLALLRHADRPRACLLTGEDRKSPSDSQNDANDPKPTQTEACVMDGQLGAGSLIAADHSCALTDSIGDE
jgi:hypothetical protein